MKPVPFEYCRADTLEEVYELLDEFGSDASIISGGLSLGAMLNMRLVRPAAVVDINGVADLSQIDSDSGSVITGALVRQAVAMAAPDLISGVPLLAQALPYVGHYQTQSRGTLGGSVAHADPSAEIPLSLVTLGGSVDGGARHGSSGEAVFQSATLAAPLPTHRPRGHGPVQLAAPHQPACHDRWSNSTAETLARLKPQGFQPWWCAAIHNRQRRRSFRTFCSLDWG